MKLKDLICALGALEIEGAEEMDIKGVTWETG